MVETYKLFTIMTTEEKKLKTKENKRIIEINKLFTIRTTAEREKSRKLTTYLSSKQYPIKEKRI